LPRNYAEHDSQIESEIDGQIDVQMMGLPQAKLSAAEGGVDRAYSLPRNLDDQVRCPTARNPILPVGV
jgi:hypothetical protein